MPLWFSVILPWLPIIPLRAWRGLIGWPSFPALFPFPRVRRPARVFSLLCVDTCYYSNSWAANEIHVCKIYQWRCKRTTIIKIIVCFVQRKCCSRSVVTSLWISPLANLLFLKVNNSIHFSRNSYNWRNLTTSLNSSFIYSHPESKWWFNNYFTSKAIHYCSSLQTAISTKCFIIN